MFKLRVKILKDECWYGGNVFNGSRMPLKRFSLFKTSDVVNIFYNQASPFYVSNKGRFIYSDDGFKVTVFGLYLLFKSKTAEIKLYDGYENLKDAYLAASNMFFKPTGHMPPLTKFVKPQYCTWIELLDEHNQKDVLEYAQSIVDSGMPIGEIIIDDGWQKEFGEWVFDPETFENPKEMIKELKSMGFNVSLWICPFVDENTKHAQYLIDNNCLVKNNKGEVAKRRWWNGVSYVLDLTNDKAVEWFCQQCQYLIDEYDIDGFKQDAGDAFFYRKKDITTKPTSPNNQSELWAKLARKFDFNELRACWKCGGEGFAQRLSDKWHVWNRLTGIRSIIPNMQLLGIIGHPFSCPDMIGGGLECHFNKDDENDYDHELFIRSSQISALMPMMQYSFSLWKLKNKQTASLCKEAAFIHQDYVEYIKILATESATTNEPIIRYMEYEFPGEKSYKAKQQFMLGNRFLVAPMVWKKRKTRKIYLPSNSTWKLLYNDKVYEGGQIIKIEVPIDKLPILERI